MHAYKGSARLITYVANNSSIQFNIGSIIMMGVASYNINKARGWKFRFEKAKERLCKSLILLYMQGVLIVIHLISKKTIINLKVGVALV